MTGITATKIRPERDEKRKEDLVQENLYPSSGTSIRFYYIFSCADAFDWFLMVIGTVGAAGSGLALPIYVLVFTKILERLGRAQNVNQYILYVVYIAITVSVTSLAEIVCWMHTSERQTSKMRYKYLEAILKQDIAVFDTDMRTGAVLDSFSTDFLLIQDAIGEQMGSFIQHTTTVLVSISLSFLNVWRVALVVLTMVPAVAVIGALYTSLLSKLTSKRQRAQGVVATITEEVLSQIRTVYSYVGESKARESFSKDLETVVKLGYKEGLVSGIGMGVLKGLLYVEWGVLMWYAGVILRKDIANPSDTLASVISIVIGLVYIGYTLSSVNSITKGRAAYKKIAETITRKQSFDSNRIDGSKPTQLKGTIEFKNVEFRYPSRPNVIILQNFNLYVPAGKPLALVGGSGSGKSTVISLLERFYESIQGEILVDQLDIKTLNTKWLRQQIGLVGQEPVLFSTSIRENILYGKEDANDEEIIAAAQAANAHDFIANFPHGYNTQVGERGIQLSGGQKQRIAIARAIVKNPKILLLDEATSALDCSCEHVVQTALNDIMAGRTTVVVAHRLSTIKNVHTIAVMGEGCVVEMGSHEELMAKEDGGIYFNLVKLQEVEHPNNEIKQTVPSIPPSSGDRESSPDAQAHQNHENEEMIISELSSEDVPVNGSVWRILKMTRQDCSSALLGILGAILLGCVSPVFSLFLAETIAVFVSPDRHDMKEKVMRYALVMIGLSAMPLIGQILELYFFGITGENLSRRVREKMLAAILRNEVGWFDQNENTSLRISTRLSSDGAKVKTVIGETSLIFENLTNFIASLVICWVIQWEMSFLLLATFPILAAANVAQKLAMKGFGGDQAKAHSEATVVAGEAVSNMRTLVAFNGEDKVLCSFQHLLSEPVKRSLRKGQISGFIYGLSQFGMYGSYALALWYGSKLVQKGTANFSNVIVVYVVLVIAAISMSVTMLSTPTVANSREAVKSVFKILDRETQMEPDDTQAFKVENLKGEVEFRQVKFCYPTRPKVTILKNLNIKVEAGNSLALVGASGCGKSSIIALIERFYDPVAGTVMIDGLDVKTLHLRSLRKHIALVQQEPALFATSIRDNILYGNEGAMEEEVIKAATIANAHEFISKLPEGYGTVVGERGVEMSGGQKQRLAIARAVLKNPRILLLDEATSGLDSESESVVQDALDWVMGGRTSIVVAHRLSTIKNVSIIAVVKNGKIAEQGSHAQLLARDDGEYYRLLNINTNRSTT